AKAARIWDWLVVGCAAERCMASAWRSGAWRPWRSLLFRLGGRLRRRGFRPRGTLAEALCDGRLQEGGLLGPGLWLSPYHDADAIPRDPLVREAHTDDEGSALDEIGGDSAAFALPPAAGIVAVVAIVAHHPHFAGLDLIRPLVVTTQVRAAREVRFAIAVLV